MYLPTIAISAQRGRKIHLYLIYEHPSLPKMAGIHFVFHVPMQRYPYHLTPKWQEIHQISYRTYVGLLSPYLYPRTACRRRSARGTASGGILLAYFVGQSGFR